MWSRGAMAILAVLLLPCGFSAAADCGFDASRLSFAGSPREQALCLTRAVRVGGALAPKGDSLPMTLAGIVGEQVNIPREVLRSYLAAQSMTEAAMGGLLDKPVSHADGGTPGAPQARYFVIHDTSSPYLRDTPFPADLDTNAAINRFDQYRAGGNEAAHLFINRAGDVLVGHDLSVPWRATKREHAAGTASKGLFLHVELLQPRRRDPTATGAANDRLAPAPGFSTAQYTKLSLAYLMASRRAGTWLIPAFHATIDEGIADGHDDPQHFSLEAFDVALASLLQAVRR